MSKAYTFLLILMSISLSMFAQEIEDEVTKNLNELIQTANNRHVSKFCEIVGGQKEIIQSDDAKLLSLIEPTINDLIQSRSYNSNELTKTEVIYKLKYDAFKICKDYKDHLLATGTVNSNAYQFIFLLENGQDVTPFLTRQDDCGKIAHIENSIKIISENVFMDLSDLQSDDDSYKIRYFKFYPRDRKEGEILKSAENLVAELTFSFKDNLIDEIELDTSSKLYKILHKNYSQPVMNIPAPEPEPIKH